MKNKDNKNLNLRRKIKLDEEQKRRNYMLTTTRNSIENFDKIVRDLGFKGRGAFIDSLQEKDFNYFSRKMLHTNVLLKNIGVNINQIARKLNSGSVINASEIKKIIELFSLMEEHLERVHKAVQEIK